MIHCHPSMRLKQVRCMHYAIHTNQVYININEFAAACFSGQKVRGVCKGDSGSPIFWEDKSDNDKTYLMSVMSKVSPGTTCHSNTKYAPPSGIWVPAIQDWISSVGGTELDDCSP